MKQFRTNGAIGALLDEYEKAYLELDATIAGIDQATLLKIADPLTKDIDCRSIQTILTHVVHAGYNYVVVIRKSLGETVDYYTRDSLDSIQEYRIALKKMFEYNVQLFEDHPDIQMENYDNDAKIKVRWGQSYDVEQLMEHAIVHILRHRRQIERFLLL